MYGLFGKVHKGRAVFPQFSRGQYIFAKEFNPSKPLIRSFDFGFNRPAVVWAQMEGSQIVVLAELMGKEVYLQDFIRDEVLTYQQSLFGQLLHKPIDFCDPRGSDESDKGKSSVQILNEHGIFPAYRRTWIEEGIKVMKDLLDTKNENDEPNMIIHPRCKTLIEGFRGGYHREQGEDKPHKDGFYEHLMDALRYLCLHAVQRAKISSLNRNAQSKNVYVNPITGRRCEF